MASWCPSCGRNVEVGEKFCRQCGMPQELTGEEATTWLLTPQPAPGSTRQTTRVQPGTTSPAVPPPQTPYYSPASAAYYRPPPPPAGQPHISLGEWLSGGWQVYKENWAMMSVATLLGGLLSIVTAGILAGPLLMGLFRMAFKTMRGERPEIGDLFNWQGRFLQAFLTFLIFALVHVGLTGFGNGPVHALLSFIVTPMLTMMMGLTMPSILERGMDVAKAINEVSRMVFSKDALMWWVTGLVFAAITAGSVLACGIGVLVALPWIVSSSAVAFRDVFGLDDPNRTLH